MERRKNLNRVLSDILTIKYNWDSKKEEKRAREENSIEEFEEFDSVLAIDLYLDDLKFSLGKNPFFLPQYLFLENIFTEKKRDEIREDFQSLLKFYCEFGNLKFEENEVFFILFDFFEYLILDSSLIF